MIRHSLGTCRVTPYERPKVVLHKLQKNDIDLFNNSFSKDKSKNDLFNKKREQVFEFIANSNNKNHPYFKDERWVYVKDHVTDLLHQLYKNYTNDKKISFDSWNVIHKAGRKHNYDFEIEYFKKGRRILHIPKVEFKNEDSGSLEKLPQVVSWQINSTATQFILKKRYDAYYYEKALDNVIALYPKKLKLKQLKPSIETYEKYIRMTDASCSPFFETMYNYEDEVLKEKSDIVCENIHQYLKSLNKKRIDYDKIEDKLNEAIANKTFVMWNGDHFNVEILDDKIVLDRDYELQKGKNNLYHTIKFKTDNNSMAFMFLLRWRNRKGILNPAFQVSMKFTE
jgi:hypothetical protein